MSNLKQIGSAALAYAEDYDGNLPPAVISSAPATVKKPPVFFSVGRDDVFHVHYWFGWSNFSSFLDYETDAPGIQGLLDYYVKSPSVFLCPDTMHGIKPVYMVSDLAAGAKLSDFVKPSSTVMVMDGEDNHLSVGHSFLPESGSLLAKWNPSRTKLLAGAAVRNAATRHLGGANYLFADGHVHWSKPEKVFFPLQGSSLRAHFDPKTGQSFGPDPAQVDFTYTATFFLR